MNTRHPDTAEDLAGAILSLVAQALGLCAQASADELELVEMLLRDARDVLDDSRGNDSYGEAPGAPSPVEPGGLTEPVTTNSTCAPMSTA